MLQKVAEIVYKKVEDRTVTSRELAKEVIALFPGKVIPIEPIAEVISEYGKTSTGLEEAVSKIITFVNTGTVGNISSGEKPELAPGSEDEEEYILHNFGEPERVKKLVKYLRDSGETVNIIDVEETNDYYGEYEITFNDQTYVLMSVESATEQAIESRAQYLWDNAWEIAREDIRCADELCHEFGYSYDEYVDDEDIIFRV